MDKEKQIEEMAKIISNTWLDDLEGNTFCVSDFLDNVNTKAIATDLTDKGYRKITDNEFVISKEEYDALKTIEKYHIRSCGKDVVVISKEEYEGLKQAKTLLEFREETIKLLEDANIRYAEALELKVNIKERKETAREIFKAIKDKFPIPIEETHFTFTTPDLIHKAINDIAKEFGVDLEGKV